MQVESHQIEDLSLLDEVNAFIDQSDWYVLGKPTLDTSVLIKKRIHPDGYWIGQKVIRNLTDFDPRMIVDTASIIRQPYGWDDESTARRAPIIYKLFQYVSSTFFNNSFTLDGVGEEVVGSDHLFFEEENSTIPNWKKEHDQVNASPVWTAYCNGGSPLSRRRGSIRFRNVDNGAHRDWYGQYGDSEEDVAECYTLLICANKTWKYTHGNDLILYETVPPSFEVDVHRTRGYGVGKPTHIFGHTPGLVILYGATVIHASSLGGRPLNSPLSKRIAFRVRRKKKDTNEK